MVQPVRQASVGWLLAPAPAGARGVGAGAGGSAGTITAAGTAL